MAHDASIRSFTFGEYAVRFSAAPISSGIAVNAFFKISSVMGFMVFDLFFLFRGCLRIAFDGKFLLPFIFKALFAFIFVYKV
jgi:hypothetical protein